VPGLLFDTNVWLAAVFAHHPSHALAQRALQQATPTAPAYLCRATQQGFLRLASTPSLSKRYGVSNMTNREAWVTLDLLQALPQVRFVEEPIGVLALWRTFSTLDSASPKVWMDAYLAAFAIAGGLGMVTFDGDFRTYTSKGLTLELIKPDQSI
jgi:uncharacterized protein